MRDGGAGGGKDPDYSDCAHYLVFLEREKKKHFTEPFSVNIVVKTSAQVRPVQKGLRLAFSTRRSNLIIYF